MNELVSSEPTELDSDHGDVNSRLGDGGRLLVIAHELTIVHESAEGAFHNPSARQHLESFVCIGAFDDFDRQSGTQLFDPLGKGCTGVAAVHPQDAQSKNLCTVPGASTVQAKCRETRRNPNFWR